MMEGAKDKTSEKVGLEAFYAPGAIQSEPSEKEEPEEEVEGEAAEDSAEEDATEDESSEEDSDDGDSEEDEDDDEKDDDLESEEDDEESDEDVDERIKKAEKKRAGFQSEAAKLRNKNKELELKLEEVKQQQQALLSQINQNQNFQPAEQQEEDGLADVKQILAGDPDDFPTKQEIIKLLDAVEKKNRKVATVRQKGQVNVAWMQSQPDFKEVDAYARKNNLAADPYFSGASTDETGAYFAVRAKLQADKMRKLEVENKRLKKIAKKRKGGNIPKTGFSGAPSKGGRSPRKDGIESFWTSVSW